MIIDKDETEKETEGIDCCSYRCTTQPHLFREEREWAQCILQGVPPPGHLRVSIEAMLMDAFHDTGHYLWRLLQASSTAHVIDFLLCMGRQELVVAQEVIIMMVASRRIHDASAITLRMLAGKENMFSPDFKSFALRIARDAPEVLNFIDGRATRRMSDLIPARTMRKDFPVFFAILKEKYIRSLLTLHLVLKPWQRRDSALIVRLVHGFLSPYTFFATPEVISSAEPNNDAIDDSRSPSQTRETHHSYYSRSHSEDGTYSEPSEDIGEESADYAAEVVEEPNAQVVQEIVHDEPAVPPDPSDALVADELWARSVEHLIQQDVVLQDHEHGSGSSTVNESVYLLHFNRYPDAFRKALIEGEALQECRSAMEEADCPWHLHQSGAKVFVHPSQYKATLAALHDCGVQLRPYHVIVSDSLESLVQEALISLPYRQGARVRVRDELIVARDASSSEASIGKHPAESTEASVFWFLELGVERTFIGLVRPRRDAESVTQSTTEVHGGSNPRRLTLLTLSDE